MVFNLNEKNGKTLAIVVMGVTGSGKSTVGQMLAERLNWEFYDADDFHPEENKTKMSNGIPLDDNDRMPWLKALATLISTSRVQNESLVLACSALKKSYRKILREASPDLQFVYLKGSPDLIADRLESRHGHFMNPALLSTQFATLEEPDLGNSLHIEIVQDPNKIVDNIISSLSS